MANADSGSFNINLDAFTVDQLKGFLVALNDKTQGSKTELINRLHGHGEQNVKFVIESFDRLRESIQRGNSMDDHNNINSSVAGERENNTLGSLRSEMAELRTMMRGLMQTVNGALPERCNNTFIESQVVPNQQNIEHRGVPVLPTLNGRQSATTSSGNTHNVHDVQKMMPEFHHNKGMSSKAFIDRVDQLRCAYEWPENVVLYALYGQLKGPAKSWLDAMPIFASWDEFKLAFLADFPCEINTAELNMQMMKSRIERNESYSDYFYRMLTLGRSGQLSDATIITYIIHGIWDETVRKILSAMHFQNCAELLKAMSQLPTGNKRSFEQNVQVAMTNKNITVTTQQQKPSQYNNTNTPSNRFTSIVQCYRCHKNGHIARNCPLGRPNVNNISIDAELQIDEHEDAVVNNISVNKYEEKQVNLCHRGLVQEVCIVGDCHVSGKALIDSGSMRSLVKRTIAEKCCVQIEGCSETLKGFAGGTMVCQEKIVVKIKFKECEYPAELLVIDDKNLTYDVLIGMDVLSAGTVLIDRGVCYVMPVEVEDIGKKLKINPELSDKVIDEFYEVINHFSYCFGEDMSMLGKSSTFKMDINLTSTIPVVRNPYPIPIPKQHIVEKLVDQLLTLGIVRHSESSYASPIVLVGKSNGEHRLCVDFRELNAITEKQPWQMPTVDGVLATLANKRYFTTLDMMSGYYQIELTEESKKYTGFVTHNGHYEFCRMPFGLRNAPSAFQRMMTKLIAPLGKMVTCYVDEIVIATPTAEENITILRKFLELVEREGLTLRISKCSFLQSMVSFLGHEVDKNGIRPGEKKVAALSAYPTPTCQHDVRRFIGLASFFRKFVPGFAIMVKPITNLLRKNIKFEWSNDCEEAFMQIKSVLSSEPVLTVYDPNKKHQLHTDASCVGLAAILLQQEDDMWKPVAYFSRACTQAERKYHAYELEVLAVVNACERFRTYLLGKEFTIVTDCQALSSTKLKKPMIPRVARWFLKLLEYECEIVHRPGTSMAHVDALSRAIEVVNDEDEPVMNISIEDWVAAVQQQDPELKRKIDILNNLITADDAKNIMDEYCIRKNRLFKRMDDNKVVLAVPKGLRWRVVQLCHDEMGHLGVESTLNRIKEHFWFPRARNFVKSYIKSCVECAYHREPRIKEAQLYGMEIPKMPFQTLHIDHLGPFIKSKRGNEYVLVAIDALTRYCIITPTKTTKSKPVIETLMQLSSYFGLPEKVVSDRGTAFTSSMFADFCNENGIQHIKVAVRTPRANGLVERVNQAILQCLKPSVNEDLRDWDHELRSIQWMINTRVNSTTKMSPIDLVFDFPLRDITGNKLLTVVYDETHINMNNRREKAINNIAEARNKWKIRFDAKHNVPKKYDVGDLVLLQTPPVSTGESKKLQPCYKGPYEVARVLRYDRYVINDIDGQKRSNRKFSTVAAADKIKPWCALIPEIDDDYEDDSDTEV